MPHREHRNTLRRRIIGTWGICLSLLFVSIWGLLQPGTAVAGKATPNGAIWFVDFDFTQQQVDATITVQVGHFKNGEMVNELASDTQPLVCVEVGALQPDSDGLYFDGDSYLECDFPNIAEIAWRLSDKTLYLGPQALALNPYFEADFWIDPHATNSAELPPTLFYHPDLALAVDPDPNNNDATLMTRVDQARSWSDPYQLSGGIDITTAHLKVGNNPFKYSPQFHANGQELTPYGTNLTNQQHISTGATTIYVGRGGFTGVISRLKVDPPCIGGGI